MLLALLFCTVGRASTPSVTVSRSINSTTISKVSETFIPFTQPFTDSLPITTTSSSSISISDSGGIKGGYLQWEIPGSTLQYSGTWIPQFDDTDLKKRNFTFYGRILHDKLDVHVRDPFSFLNISVVDEEYPQPRGISARMLLGEVIIPESWWYNATHFSLRFIMDDFFEIRDDQLVKIQLLSNITMNQLDPQNFLYARIIAVKYPRNDALVSLLSTNGFAAGAMQLLIGVPGSHEIQAAVMVAYMTCIDKDVFSLSDGTEILLSPLPFTDTPHGKLAGCLVFPLYVFGLYLSLLYTIHSNVKSITYKETATRTHYPSVPLCIMTMMFPGAVFYFVRSMYSVIVGALTVIVLLVSLLSFIAVCTVLYFLWGHKWFLDRRYTLTIPEKYRGWRKFVYARGRWGPPEVRVMFRSVIGEVDAAHLHFMLVPFVCCIMWGAVSAWQPTSRSVCRFQFSVMAVMFGGYVLYQLINRPFRYFYQNLASAMNGVCLICLTGSSAVNNEDTEFFNRIGLFFLFFNSLGRSAFTSFTVYLEGRYDRYLDSIQHQPAAVPTAQNQHDLENYHMPQEVVSEGDEDEEYESSEEFIEEDHFTRR